MDFDFLLIFQISAKSINRFGFYSCFRIYHLKSKKIYYFPPLFFSKWSKISKNGKFCKNSLYYLWKLCKKSEKNRLKGQKTKLKKYWFVQEMVPWSDTATYTVNPIGQILWKKLLQICDIQIINLPEFLTNFWKNLLWIHDTHIINLSEFMTNLW